MSRLPLIALVLVAPLLAGCDSKADEHASSGTDVRRAEAAWPDPWLAPADLNVATHGYGSNGYVVRYVGQRRYVAAATPAEAAATEVRAAVGHGWELIGAACDRRRVLAQVARGDELDDAVLGVVTASRRGRGAAVTVSGQVPHHADGSWPPLEATPLDPADTCLGGRPATTPLVELPQGPTSGEGEPGPDDFEGWRRDDYTDDEQALLAALAADPWIAATVPEAGQRLAPRDDLRTGDSRRFGAYAAGALSSTDRDSRSAVAAIVATMTNWVPTWAACSPGPNGSSDTVDVRLRWVSDAGVATVRLLRNATSRNVRWTLNTPLPEGPDPSWVADTPALEGSTCLSSDPLPDGLTIEGEPVSLPTKLQPVP